MDLIRTRQELPCTVQTVTLDGITCRLTLTYRGYCQAWYLDLSLLDGTDLLTGVRIEPDADLLLLAAEGAPPGVLLALQTGQLGDAGVCSTAIIRSTVTGISFTLAPGQLFTDPAGNYWTPAIEAALPQDLARDVAFVALVPGPTALAAGAVLTPVSAPATISAAALQAAVPGVEALPYLREDLGPSLALVYVPLAEIP